MRFEGGLRVRFEDELRVVRVVNCVIAMCVGK